MSTEDPLPASDADLHQALLISAAGGADAQRQTRQLVMSLRRVREERDAAVLQLSQARRSLIPARASRG